MLDTGLPCTASGLPALNRSIRGVLSIEPHEQLPSQTTSTSSVPKAVSWTTACRRHLTANAGGCRNLEIPAGLWVLFDTEGKFPRGTAEHMSRCSHGGFPPTPAVGSGPGAAQRPAWTRTEIGAQCQALHSLLASAGPGLCPVRPLRAV